MKRLFLIGLCLAILGACTREEGETTPNTTIEKDMVMRILEMKNMRSSSPLYRHMQQQMTSMTASHNSKKNGTTAKKDTAYDYEEYQTCAKYTREEKDGFIIETWDYGTGCDDYGTLTKGKFINKWKENDADYYWETIYENYEQTYTYVDYGDGADSVQLINKTETYKMNGYYTSVFAKADLEADDDSYSGTYTSTENMTYEWNGIAYLSKGQSKTTYTPEKCTDLSGEFLYKQLDGSEEYVWTIIEPIVWDYECENTWVAVSGIEKYSWKTNDENEEAITNYGDGTCDNLVEITINGETEVVDMSEQPIICGVQE